MKPRLGDIQSRVSNTPLSQYNYRVFISTLNVFRGHTARYI